MRLAPPSVAGVILRPRSLRSCSVRVPASPHPILLPALSDSRHDPAARRGPGGHAAAGRTLRAIADGNARSSGRRCGPRGWPCSSPGFSPCSHSDHAPAGRGSIPLRLSSPFGYFGNLLAAPFARWDSVWYLSIAERGYGHTAANTAFFPLYPMAIRLFGHVTDSYLIAGILVSLVAFAIGLALLRRLALMDLDADAADLTVLLLAFCPMAYFFSAVYTESLYLALSVGCFLQARQGRWALAGLLGGLAAASRNSGIMLLVPFVILYLYGPRQDRPVPSASWARAPLEGWRRLLPRHAPRLSLAWGLLIPRGSPRTSCTWRSPPGTG